MGLKATNARVIWGLKDTFKLPEENKNFWVKPWLPQIECLNHPAVKVCLTHCGMGGSTECISAGIPVVTWPHFGDQQPNSQCITKDNKAGIALYDEVRMSNKIDENLTFL